MNWIDRAERKFGHLAIPGLINIIVGLNALVYVLFVLNPGFLTWLYLDPSLVLQGQVWRLVTFLFIPSIGGGLLPQVLVVLLYLMFLHFVGSGLERAMGSFRMNLFYFMGALGIIVAAFIHPVLNAPFLLNTTLLLAFARYYPDVVIYLFFVLPVKVRWLAWFSGALLIWGFLTEGWGYRVALVAALLNYWLFFGKEILEDARHRRKVTERRDRFEKEVKGGAAEFIHECVVCKRTDQSSPELEFRVARDGQEYCLEHLPKRTAG